MDDYIFEPCPFCGGQPEWIVFKKDFDSPPSYELQCMSLSCELAPCTELHDSKEEAAAAWNKRYQPTERRQPCRT